MNLSARLRYKYVLAGVVTNGLPLTLLFDYRYRYAVITGL
jgi:hypothetical protein